MAPRPRPGRVALALCAALALPAARAEGELAEGAWEDDDACPAGAPAACALSLRQLRARGAAPLAAARVAGEAPREEAHQEPPPAAGEPEMPGGWGEAASYADELANLTTKASLTRGWGSCAMYGCIGYYSRGHGCQCNSACQRYGNCCGDYWSRCRRHHHHHAPAPAPAHQRKLMTLFHQTSPQACSLILKSNFRPGSQGWCGGGIYFATSAKATETKAIGPDSHKGCILQAVVDVGRVMYLSQTCDRGLTGRRVWAKGYDSVSFDPGDGQEYIVYSSSSVLSVQKAR